MEWKYLRMTIIGFMISIDEINKRIRNKLCIFFNDSHPR